ncbi:MAG: CBS domain-containing protein [Pseudomonadota bacterium]|nr:MAG: hypothetical protein DIU78_17345 [Pseudomonadota bacterium]
MIVQEIMSPDPYAAKTTTPIREVMRLLMEADVRHIPIVENGALVGIVSDRDLRSLMPSALIELDRPREIEQALQQPISTVMNTDVVCLHPESDLLEGIDLMIEHKIGAIPVVEPDSEKLVGIVSYVDVLRAARDLI